MIEKLPFFIGQMSLESVFAKTPPLVGADSNNDRELEDKERSSNNSGINISLIYPFHSKYTPYLPEGENA